MGALAGKRAQMLAVHSEILSKSGKDTFNCFSRLMEPNSQPDITASKGHIFLLFNVPISLKFEKYVTYYNYKDSADRLDLFLASSSYLN